MVTRLLALMPGWTGTAEALRDVVLFLDTESERVDGARLMGVRDAEAARSHRADLTARDKDARSALSELRESPLPDLASVLAARAERHRGMELVLARAFGEAPSAAVEAAFAGDEPMPLAFRRHRYGHSRTFDHTKGRRRRALSDG